jgi:peptidoglycan/xylan/chitin deacetylase (PgdA/CDA1 family)
MKLIRTPRLFAWIFPRKTWGFSRKEKAVYLTFDDGPDPLITPWILQFLKDNNLKATFFCVGENVKNNQALFQQITADGHAIGNHTMNHEKGTHTPFTAYIQSIEEAQQWMNTRLFRPPYGRLTFRQTQRIARNFRIIMWTWLSYDYDKNIPIEFILKKANKITNGDILLLHDNKKSADRLKVILPPLVDIIRQKGLEFRIVN